MASLAILPTAALPAYGFKQKNHCSSLTGMRAGGKKIEGQRDYWAGATKSEEKTIKWIVKTLGTATKVSILKDGLELKRKGDTLSNVHPYNFLLVIFREEEMKCHVRAIKLNGGLAKSGFYSGICESLEKESNANNLKDEYLVNFAKRIGMDPSPMRPFISGRQWEAFVDYLILNAPRETDPNRYNM